MAHVLRKGVQVNEKDRLLSSVAILTIVIAVALAIRLFIALSVYGHSGDLHLFSIWAQRMGTLGAEAFYSGNFFCDYPPGYLYVLQMVDAVLDAVRTFEGQPLWLIIMKMPAMLCDCATGVVLWCVARRTVKHVISRREAHSFEGAEQGEAIVGSAARVSDAVRSAFTHVKKPSATFMLVGAPVVVAALYVFNPAVIMDSAAWGQVDGILAFLLVSAFACFLRAFVGTSAWRFELTAGQESAPSGQQISIAWMVAGGVLWVLGIVAKLQAIIVAPAVLAMYLIAIQRDHSRGGLALAISVPLGIMVATLAIIPFTVRFDVLSVLARYADTLSSYPFASMNGMNIYVLAGENRLPQTDILLFLPCQTWGTIALVLLVAFVVVLYVRSVFGGTRAGRVPACCAGDVRLPVLLAAVLIVGFFTFSVRVHERYLFCALVFLLVAAVLYRDKHLLVAYILSSIVEALSMGIVLSGRDLSNAVPLDVAGCLIMIATCVYVLVRAWRLSGWKIEDHRCIISPIMQNTGKWQDGKN